MLFGAHCSTAGGLHRALERAEAIGASLCQVFVKNNMQWFGRPYETAAIAAFRTKQAATKLQAIFGHTGYLINLGAAPSENREKSLKSLVQEIELAGQIGLPFLVLHPGAHLGAGEDEGLKRIAAALNDVFRITKRSPVRIALENTAGQGSCLGCKLEHLAVLFDLVNDSKRLGVCLDTAHFLAAGYDIRSRKGWEQTIDRLDALVGVQQILAFHLNDSKTELGSRVDRHAHIGQGKIGVEGFRHIVNDPRFADHPGCLETPKSDDLHEDRDNLQVLRSLLEPDRKRSRVQKAPALSHAMQPKPLTRSARARKP